MDLATADRLVVLHNVTSEKCESVLRLGGFPAPSLGVTKVGLPYTTFGEISFIGSRFLVDPRIVPVYACDAFTASAPRTPQGHLAESENAEAAVRRMVSAAARRRRGPYGTGRLMADAVGCFPSMRAMQAARRRVVEPERARFAMEYLDSLLDTFVLGVTPCHRSHGTASVARRETSIMKALLTAYRHGGSRRTLTDALTCRNFAQPPERLLRTGEKILRLLGRMPTAYFEAKPPRLLKLTEFVGVVLPRNSSASLVRAFRQAGLHLRFFNPADDSSVRVRVTRQFVLELARLAGDFLSPAGSGKILFKSGRRSSHNRMSLCP